VEKFCVWGGCRRAADCVPSRAVLGARGRGVLARADLRGRRVALAVLATDMPDAFEAEEGGFEADELSEEGNPT